MNGKTPHVCVFVYVCVCMEEEGTGKIADLHK